MLKTRIFTWMENRRKLHDWPIMGSQLLVQWTTSYFLSYQDCHLFQQQFVFNIELNRSVKLFQTFWTIIRSSHDSKWQACMRETDADRSWHTGHGKPWTSTRTFFRQIVLRRIHRKVFLIGYSPSQLISRTWRCTCLYIHLKERIQIRMVMLQKWGYKNGSTVFLLTSAKTGRDLVHEQKRLVTWKQQSSKVNLGTITSSLPWCKISLFSGYYPWKTQTSQETEKNLRKLLEPSQMPKVIHMDDFWEFGKYCEELSWNHRTAFSHRLETRNCRTSCNVEKKKIHQAYYCNLDWMKNNGQIPWNAITICKMSKTSWQTGNLRYDRRSGESFKGPFFYSTHWLDISQKLRKMKQEFTKFGKRGILLVMYHSRWNLGKIFWSLTLENQKRGDRWS